MVSGAAANTPAESEQEAGRRAVMRAMWVGMWVWPAFVVLDAFMCFVAYPDAPFSLFLLYRATIELLFVGVYRASRRGTLDATRLFGWLNVSYGFTAIAISLMAVHLGGIVSPYMHGISVVALIRAALVPTHWRQSMRTYGRIGLAFPLVMAVVALFSPAYRAEWVTTHALTAFASNYIFVIASSFLGMVSGHVVWTAQEQLYRARRVGRYRLQAPIGKGGMGDVWLAWDLSLRRNVALKILRTGAAPDSDTLKRFEREAHSAGQLRGPHIVRVFDFGASDDGLYYIAMEYLPGLDLGTMVEDFGPVSGARAINIIMQACGALEEAHEAGIIHRDLKPHNLFLTRVGDNPDFVKLLDFGVARLRDHTASTDRLTWTGIVIGTPSYLAPELWQGAPADERSDIYALGATLHFLLSGATPSASHRHGAAREAGPGTTHPDYNVKPAELVQIVRRCLAASPADRFQSARELRAELERVYEPTAWTRADAEEFWHAVDRRRFGA